MILFCVTECLGSFEVAAKKFAAGFQNCRQTLFIAGKHFLLQANVFFCRHLNKLQAGPARTLKIGNASSDFNIAFL
jgi:hypothetical protein